MRFRNNLDSLFTFALLLCDSFIGDEPMKNRSTPRAPSSRPFSYIRVNYLLENETNVRMPEIRRRFPWKRFAKSRRGFILKTLNVFKIKPLQSKQIMRFGFPGAYWCRRNIFLFRKLKPFFCLLTETSGGLSSQGVAAICLSVGISLLFVLAIGFFLRRGKRKIKHSKQRQRARTLSQCSLQVTCNKLVLCQELNTEGRL